MLAYLGLFVGLWALDVSFNLISAMALIVILGILVDDSIVVAEAYSANLEQGLDRVTAALKASQNLLIPVTTGLLTTVIAYIPMMFFSSQMSDYLVVIPIVVCLGLFMSWIDCFIIMPNHLLHVKVSHRPATSKFLLTLYGYLLGICIEV